jgi:hypothetical protein
VSPLETIRRLVSFEGRWPGTAAERSAAEHLAGELEGLGRSVDIEPIRVRPAYHLTHAIHATLAVVGSVVSVHVPPLGVAILLLAAASMFGDLNARFYIVRMLMPRRRSQNVTSPGSRPDTPARIVLTAHYDAARSGWLFNRRSRPPPRIMQRAARLAGPIDVVFWTIVVALVLSLVRLINDSTLLTWAQFAPTILLIAAVILFVDVALSEVVPGASDNASGVAAVLEVARRLDADPPTHIDTWVALTGAKEGFMLGMREWMKAHQEDIDPRRTFFINVDTVGKGTARPVSAEGFVLLYQHDARLVEMAQSLRANGRDQGNGDRGPAPTPHIWRLGTDGVIPLMRGFPSLTICCTDRYDRTPDFHQHSDTVERVEEDAVKETIDLVEALVRAIDTKLVPSLLPTLVEAPPKPAGTS